MATDGDSDLEKFRAKVRAIVGRIRTKQAETYELTEELQRLLDADPTEGNQIKRLFASWQRIWSQRYVGQDYVFTNAKDAGQFKRLLRTLPADEIEGRMARFVQTSEPFLTSNRHPLGAFVSGINSYGAPMRDRIVGCEHQPPCGTESEHTRRRMADMRGGSHSGPTGDVL